MDRDFSELIQESARGSLVLIIGQMAATLISALGTIIVARFLGPTSYGIVAIAQIPVSLVTLFLYNGVGIAVTSFIAEAKHTDREDEIKGIVYAGFIINTSIGLLATLTLYGLAGYLANIVFQQAELVILIRILSLSVLAQSVMNISLAVLAGFQQMEQRSLISILYSAMKSLIGPILIYLGYGLIGATVGTTLPTLLSGLAGIILVWYYIKSQEATIVSITQNIKRIIRYAYPLFLSSLLSGSITRVLEFILPLYVSAATMGNYAASTGFSVLLTFFMTPLSTSMLPLLSKLRPTDDTLEFVYSNLIKYESIIVFPIASAIMILSNQMVEILYGKSYPQTPLYISVLMLSYFFTGLGDGTSNNLLNSQGQTKITLRSTIFFIILGAPLGFLLIPRYGALGYQFTILFVPKLGLLYQNWWINRNYGISIDYDLVFRTFSASTVGGVLCWIVVRFLDTNPWIELFTGGMVLLASYLFLLLFLGVLTEKNLEDIQSMVDRNKLLASVLDPLLSLMKRFARD